MSNSTISRVNENVEIRTGHLVTTFINNDCGSAANQIACLHSIILDLQQDKKRLRERNLIVELRDRHIPWSRQTFGDGMRTGGITKHIQKELDEIRENPYSAEEWIDVVILALDGAWRAGYTAESVVDVLFEKLATIRTRAYRCPLSDNEPSEHLRGEEPVDPAGVELIAKERNRQVTEEDWSDYHDDCHKHGELADAAACYAIYGHSSRSDMPAAWPWANEWWKPEEDRIRTLVKAGALIAAEIDRLLRLKKQETMG